MARLIKSFCVSFLVLFAGVATAAASDMDRLYRLIDAAEDGEPVVIPAGRYDITDLKLREDAHLKGDGDVILYSSRPTEKGLLNPLRGVSLIVENLTFEGAVSPDLNGAGIRHDGDDLTIIDCKFLSNENGVLATGAKDGVIKITGSEFINSGHGDGYSHGIYVLHAALLEISSSSFIGTKIGHHVKSLAATTVLRDNLFDDADGRTSYALDASRGGAVIVQGNRFFKSANADNSTVINYDLTRGGEAVSLTIKDNTIVNRHWLGRLLTNRTSIKPIIENNSYSRG